MGGSLQAQSSGVEQIAGGEIEEIIIEGTQRIEPATVRSYLLVDPGDPFDPAILNETLRNLFDTGLFADVRLSRVNDSLIVEVDENPIINRIAFEGNSEIDNESLRGEVELRPRVVFTRTKVQNDVARLTEVYRRSGHFGVQIEPKVIVLEQNRVDLVFEIDEGPKTRIQSINFIGNRAYSDRNLRGEIVSTEAAWWRILGAQDSYDPDRLGFDRELLRRFYLTEGYADFRVDSVTAELTPDRESFIVTFILEEGERYRVGSLDLVSEIPDLDPEALRDEVRISEGDWYNAQRVEDTVEGLTEAVADRGFAFVDVRPRVQRNPEEQEVDIVFEVQEGPRVFVERINIEGNVRTEDRVIRREFRLVEGDAFNASKVRRSRQRIQNLGFFGSVSVDSVEGSEPDQTVINVEIEEQATGSLTFGGGFSTDVGPIAQVEIRERNLLGRAQDLLLNLTVAGQRSGLELSFTEPYFLDRNLAAGIDLFRIETSERNLTFDQERTGGALRAGYEIVEFWQQNWRYEFSRRDITNVDPRAALAIRLEEGKTDRSSVTHRLTYDTRDDRFDPRSGVRLFTNNTFAGLGGDVTFAKNTVGGDYFLPILEDWTLRVGAEVGQIVGINDDTRVLDRFFVGGSQLRGFASSGISPRDELTRDPLGANQFYTATVETRFPLGAPDDLPIRGRLFTDVGASWGVDRAPGDILEEKSPRLAVGAGLSWSSPLGPLDIDFGFPILSEDFDDEQIFRFSFGTRF